MPIDAASLLSDPPAPPQPAATFVDDTPEALRRANDLKRAFIESQRKAGDITDDQARAALAPFEPTAAEIDEGFPVARPEEFVLPPLPDFDENGRMVPATQVTNETLETAAAIRTWLSDGCFTAEIGSHLVNEVVRVGESMAGTSPARMQLYAREQRAQLHRMWGFDKAEERIALAARFIDDLDERHEGKVVDYLQATGAIFSATVLGQIAMHAERLQARKRKP
jgi:hypothetical protein